MLKLKAIETKEGKTYSVERIGFIIPNYIDLDQADDFRSGVFSVSDNYLVSGLTPTKSKDEWTDEDKENVEKVHAITDSPLYTDSNVVFYGRAQKAFAIGLKHIRCTAVPEEFATVFDHAVKYARKYISITEWDDDRKTEFNDIRKECVAAFDTIFDGYIKDGFALKLSSKSLNVFLNSIITFKNTTGKSKETATTYKVADIYTAFVSYMQMINTNTGVFREKKVKTINVF